MDRLELVVPTPVTESLSPGVETRMSTVPVSTAVSTSTFSVSRGTDSGVDAVVVDVSKEYARGGDVEAPGVGQADVGPMPREDRVVVGDGSRTPCLPLGRRPPPERWADGL